MLILMLHNLDQFVNVNIEIHDNAHCSEVACSVAKLVICFKISIFFRCRKVEIRWTMTRLDIMPLLKVLYYASTTVGFLEVHIQ